jgi:hypothetical protein
VLILLLALGHQSVERVCRPDSDWRARVHTHNMRYNHAVQSCVLTSPSPLRWPSERGSGARSSGDGSGAVRKRSSRATRAWGHRRSRWRCVCCDLSRAEPTVGPRNGSNRSERVQKGVAGDGHLASISGFALAVRSDTSTEVSPLQGRAAVSKLMDSYRGQGFAGDGWRVGVRLDALRCLPASVMRGELLRGGGSPVGFVNFTPQLLLISQGGNT